MLLIDNLRAACAATLKGNAIRPVRALAVYDIGYWAWTLEACLTFPRPETRAAVKSAFLTLAAEEQKALTFTPKLPGEWVERGKLWRSLLDDLSPALRCEAMLTILHWCAQCLLGRTGGSEREDGAVCRS